MPNIKVAVTQNISGVGCDSFNTNQTAYTVAFKNTILSSLSGISLSEILNFTACSTPLSSSNNSIQFSFIIFSSNPVNNYESIKQQFTSSSYVKTFEIYLKAFAQVYKVPALQLAVVNAPTLSDVSPTSFPTTIPDDERNHKNSIELSKGGIAGIVVGSIIGGILIITLAIFAVLKGNSNGNDIKTDDNSLSAIEIQGQM